MNNSLAMLHTHPMLTILSHRTGLSSALNSMQHLQEIQEDPLSNLQGPYSKELSSVQIGADLPPVTQKLT